MSGEYQFLLALALVAFPDASGNQLCTFILENSQNPKLFSRQDISKALVCLCVTQKKAATDAYQAFDPVNILKRELFWSDPFPLGVCGVSRKRLIDVDEAGFELRD